MEEVPENGKESSHSAHANGMNEQKRPHFRGTICSFITIHFRALLFLEINF